MGKRGKPTLLMTDELARAVRCESAAALCWWCGVSEAVVWRWRKALGVSRTNNEGTRRLMQAAAQKGAEAVKNKEWTAEERERKRQQSIELNCGSYFPPGSKLYPAWTRKELALLGKLPDEEVAKRIGRTTEAVRVQRTKRGIARARDRRKRQDR
jgi:hypothetical protein